MCQGMRLSGATAGFRPALLRSTPLGRGSAPLLAAWIGASAGRNNNSSFQGGSLRPLLFSSAWHAYRGGAAANTRALGGPHSGALAALGAAQGPPQQHAQEGVGRPKLMLVDGDSVAVRWGLQRAVRRPCGCRVCLRTRSP